MVLAAEGSVRDYDPELDVTAGQLRGMGASLPDDIPDCAWVPRTAMVVTVDRDKSSGLSIAFSVEFTEQFRWLEVKGVIG